VFSDRLSGACKYVGVSIRLPDRLRAHASSCGRLGLSGQAKPAGGVLGSVLESSLDLVGEDIRVALHGCEKAWWFLLSPIENVCIPGHLASSMFRMRDGREYNIDRCVSSALSSRVCLFEPPPSCQLNSGNSVA
jgi:hypothetical protein